MSRCPYCEGALPHGYQRGSSEKVRAYVYRRKTPVHYADLVEKFNMTKESAKFHLRHLMRRGKVRHLGYGKGWARA